MRISPLVRCTALSAAVLGAVVVVLPPAQARKLTGSPVADNDALYTACGRVFPDPQAYWPSPTPAPGESPWAKGNVTCRATTFITHAEAISGLSYLEKKFPEMVEVYDLPTDFEDVLNVAEGEGRSAGVPLSTLTRERSNLTLVRVTDERVPETNKKYFVFPLSIHGIERAGIEGGLRAIEDLATWGAQSPAQPVLETDTESTPTGEVLKRSSVYFVLANPDGWRRGDPTAPGVSFQRYNGNGVDLNRDFPALGYTFRPYTPWSEPESRSFGKVLKSIRNKWDGGIDLHGQLIDRAFSFTLLGASQRPYDKNQRVLQFTKGAWADAEKRLSWNPLIKPNDEPPPCAFAQEDEECDDTNRIYGVQWGTIWDTIAYTVTGAFGDWIDSPLGLDADGIDNEMSLSHLGNCGTGTCFIQSAEQLHVDGNKSLIYAMLHYAIVDEDKTFAYDGKVAYLHQPKRLKRADQPLPKAPTGVPPQEDITTTVNKTTGDATYEFDVKGPADGVHNGGLGAIVTYASAQGVGPGATMSVFVERETDDGWELVQRDYNQSNVYLQSGMKVDVNLPQAGHYRVRVSGPVAVVMNLTIDFTSDLAWPDPGKRGYDVSNLDFFEELKPFVAAPDKLIQLPVASVVDGSANLRRFDTIIAVDDTFDPRAAKALDEFVKKGGNLVLTDNALQGLEHMGVVPKGMVEEMDVYAGHVEFERTIEGEEETTYDDPLAANVDQPGAAEGPNHRHQVTEPVPIGYAIQSEDGNDLNTQPQWAVDTEAWQAASGRVVGRLGEPLTTYGEARRGAGRIRILGSFLPFPTDQFDHPFGLADYSITYTGYELAKNVLSWKHPLGTVAEPQAPVAPPRVNPPPAAPPAGPRIPTTGAEPPYAAVVALALALGYVARRRLYA